MHASFIMLVMVSIVGRPILGRDDDDSSPWFHKLAKNYDNKIEVSRLVLVSTLVERTILRSDYFRPCLPGRTGSDTRVASSGRWQKQRPRPITEEGVSFKLFLLCYYYSSHSFCLQDHPDSLCFSGESGCCGPDNRCGMNEGARTTEIARRNSSATQRQAKWTRGTIEPSISSVHNSESGLRSPHNSSQQ